MALERARAGGSELVTTPKAFGDTLRGHRERRGITLQSVADRTKIGSSMLKALERGDCSRWPGGIYSRAWIRAYAAAIGLDPDDIGEEFNRVFNRVAFPEGDPAPAPPATPVPPRIAPLRITIQPDPAERLRVLARRAMLFVADLVLAGATAAAVSVVAILSFWTAFALAAVVCHAIGLFGGGGSAAGWIERTVRQHARPHQDDASDQAAVAELA